jgi:hypothetical protein
VYANELKKIAVVNVDDQLQEIILEELKCFYGHHFHWKQISGCKPFRYSCHPTFQIEEQNYEIRSALSSAVRKSPLWCKQ